MNALPHVLNYGVTPLPSQPGCGVLFVQLRKQHWNEKYALILDNSIISHKQLFMLISNSGLSPISIFCLVSMNLLVHEISESATPYPLKLWL